MSSRNPALKFTRDLRSISFFQATNMLANEKEVKLDSIMSVINFVLFTSSQETLGNIPHSDMKSEEDSTAARQMGNRSWLSYCKSNRGDVRSLAHANIFYTKAVLAAKPQSSSLALALSNRAQVLVEFGLFDEAESNLKVALTLTGIDDTTRSTLFLRMAEFLVKSARHSEASEILAKADPLLTPEIKLLAVRESISTSKEKYKPSHAFIVNGGNDAVVDKYAPLRIDPPYRIGKDPKKGFAVYATRDIRAGEIIMVDKPIVNSLTLEENNPNTTYNCCWFCKLPSLNLSPCQNCSLVGFCSSGCREQAKKFHCYECGFISTFFTSPIFTSLIFRLMAMNEGNNSSDEWQDFPAMTDDGRSENDRPNMEDKVNTGSINEMVKRLSICFNSRQNVFKVGLAILCLKLGKILQMRGYNMQHEQHGQGGLPQIAANIFYLSLVMMNNTYALSMRRIISLDGYYVNLSPNLGQTTVDDKINLTLQSITGIYPHISFVNHSCNPNSLCFPLTADHAALVALRPINNGQQIFSCYSMSFSVCPSKQTRHQQLKQYSFTCDCEACENDWSIGGKNYLKFPDCGECESKHNKCQCVNAQERFEAFELLFHQINEINLSTVSVVANSLQKFGAETFIKIHKLANDRNSYLSKYGHRKCLFHGALKDLIVNTFIFYSKYYLLLK